MHNGMLTALSVILLIAAALALSMFGAKPALVTMCWTLAGVAPFALLREFGRRFAFAQLHVKQALSLDVAVAVTQISLLSWLGWTGQMSAFTAFGALAAACAIPAIAWLTLARRQFTISKGQVWAALSKNWSLGKWLFAAQFAIQIQSYITYWLSVVIVGAAATGVYAACMSIVSFANPFISGLRNILTPRAVMTWSDKGGEGLRQQSIRDALLIFGGMSVFCLLVVFAGENLMRLLYHSKEYEGQGHLVAVLAFSVMAMEVGAPAANALASMQRPRAIMWASVIGAVITVVLVWYLMMGWGLLGAAYGLLIGNLAGTIGRWVAFLAVVPKSSEVPQPVFRVLKQLTQIPDENNWDISRLDEGTHAHVYIVQTKDHRPVWKAHDSLVVKLFKSEAALSVEMAHAQAEALARLHENLDGRTVNSWTVSVPRPLYVCQTPLALVMTKVDGRNLNSWAATGEHIAPELWAEIASATICTVEKCWARNQVHGDLALQNILCNVEGKQLSFIDAGTLESCSICNDGATVWPPDVRDLAHLLSDVATDVKQSLGNKGARLHRQAFAETALRTYLERSGAPAEKAKLLADVEACVRAHLHEILMPSWSSQGVWRTYVRFVANRRMNRIMETTRNKLGSAY